MRLLHRHGPFDGEEKEASGRMVSYPTDPRHAYDEPHRHLYRWNPVASEYQYIGMIPLRELKEAA